MSIGAVMPSSRTLARAMTRDLPLRDGGCVVEFGPGTGPFTRAIADRLPSAADYLGIERDAGFVALLRARFPELTIVEGSAEQALKLHREHGKPGARVVVCGLPFASLPPTVQDNVIEAIDGLLADGGEFRTFQYVHAYPLPTAVRFRRRMSAIFGPCDRGRAVWRNMPPAYVLTWRRARGGQ